MALRFSVTDDPADVDAAGVLAANRCRIPGSGKPEQQYRLTISS